MEGFEETSNGQGEPVAQAVHNGFREERENRVSQVDNGNGHVSKYFKIIIVKDFTRQSLGRNKSHIEQRESPSNVENALKIPVPLTHTFELFQINLIIYNADH